MASTLIVFSSRCPNLDGMAKGNGKASFSSTSVRVTTKLSNVISLPLSASFLMENRLTLAVVLVFSSFFKSLVGVWELTLLWLSKVLLEHGLCVPVEDLMGCKNMLPLCIPHCYGATEEFLTWKSRWNFPKCFWEASDKDDRLQTMCFLTLDCLD